MNLPVTAKDAQMFLQLKLQIPRIETREGKGRTAGNLDIFKHILSPLFFIKWIWSSLLFRKMVKKKTQDLSRGMRRAQLVTGTFFEKKSL